MSIYVSRFLARLAVGVCMIAASHAIAVAGTLTERADFKPLFDAAGTDGTLLIYDLNRDTMMVYNPGLESRSAAAGALESAVGHYQSALKQLCVL